MIIIGRKALSSAKSPTPIVLNVGITGHRTTGLTAPLIRSLRPIVYTVFQQLRDATLRIQESEPAFCGSSAAELLLHTALATGADQIAAICARSTGYFVRALLPFEASEYRKDFAFGEELDHFEQALAAADEIIALPGDRTKPEAAYVLVGESLVERADVLIAIWDGEQPRGPGGTGHVVELALQSSVPVIHIDVDRSTGNVRMRALMNGNATEFRTSLHDADLYRRVLRGAFHLEPTKRQPPRTAFELTEPATAAAAANT